MISKLLTCYFLLVFCGVVKAIPIFRYFTEISSQSIGLNLSTKNYEMIAFIFLVLLASWFMHLAVSFHLKNDIWETYKQYCYSKILGLTIDFSAKASRCPNFSRYSDILFLFISSIFLFAKAFAL